MSQLWYYEDHGQAQGPISTTQLVDKVRAGELNLLDVIFRDGDEQWFPVEHFPELMKLLEKYMVEPEAEWILLRCLEVDGRQRYEQIGPFHHQQILQMVDQGKATFQDYVWKKNFTRWVPLGKVDEFEKPLPSSVKVDLSLYKMPRYEILEEESKAPVKEYKTHRKKTVVEEAAPPEAAGPDLAKPDWEIQIPEKRVLSKIIKENKKKGIGKDKAEDFSSSEATQIRPMAEKIPEPATQIRVAPEKENEKEKELAEPTQIKLTVEKTGSVAKVIPPPDHTISKVTTKTQTRTGVPPITTQTGFSQTGWQTGTQTGLKTKTPPQAPWDDDVTPPPVIGGAETAERVPLPPMEVLQSLQRRWNRVGISVGYLLLAMAVVVGAMPWLKSFNADEEIVLEEILPVLPDVDRPAPVVRARPAPVVKAPPAPIKNSVVPAVKPESTAIAVPTKPAETPVSEKPKASVSVAPATESLAQKTVESVKPLAPKKLSSTFVGMSAKEKSYYHNNERYYLFYTADKALRLSQELNTIYQKKGKNKVAWKNGFRVWQGSLRNLMKGELRNEEHLHAKLFERFEAALISLDKRAREFDAQLVSGRSPTKELSLSDIQTEIRKVQSLAKALDQ